MVRRGLGSRLGWAIPLALLAVAPACKYLPASCGKGDVAETTPPPPPRPTVSVDEVKALANSGKHEEALAMAEKAVADHPEDDAAWRMLEQEAIVSGKAGELLDRLDAANPIGGRKVPHQVLRGSLAREANRPDVMLAAGESIRAEAPMDAAAFLAAAALKGGTVEGAASAVPDVPPDAVPAGTEPVPGGQGDAGAAARRSRRPSRPPAPTGTDAPAEPAPTPAPAGPDADLLGFVRYVTAGTNDAAAPWKRQADRITGGWRADLVRGSAKQKEGTRPPPSHRSIAPWSRGIRAPATWRTWRACVSTSTSATRRRRRSDTARAKRPAGRPMRATLRPRKRTVRARRTRSMRA
jgi:hypothetical protein